VGEHLGTSPFHGTGYREIPGFLIALFVLMACPILYFNKAKGYVRTIMWLLWVTASIVLGVLVMNYELHQRHWFKWDFLLWEIGLPITIGGVQIIFVISMFLYWLYHRTKEMN
jgi:hypothetical protein